MGERARPPRRPSGSALVSEQTHGAEAAPHAAPAAAGSHDHGAGGGGHGGGRVVRSGFGRLLGPGWLRALWTTPLFGMFWLGFACLVRWLAHWHPVWSGVPLVTIATVSFP